jgi:hypothetical protein
MAVVVVVVVVVVVGVLPDGQVCVSIVLPFLRQCLSLKGQTREITLIGEWQWRWQEGNSNKPIRKVLIKADGDCRRPLFQPRMTFLPCVACS